MAECAKNFALLSKLAGPFSLSVEARDLFEDFQKQNRTQCNQADPLDEALCSRIASAPAQVLKVAMCFEAVRAVYYGSERLQIEEQTLKLAISHVAASHRAAQSLDEISQRSAIANEAELLLERIRFDYRTLAKNGSIILTRSQLTKAYASHGHRDNRVDDLCRHWIPRLVAIGDAKALPKAGKLERYAFRVEGP